MLTNVKDYISDNCLWFLGVFHRASFDSAMSQRGADDDEMSCYSEASDMLSTKDTENQYVRRTKDDDCPSEAIVENKRKSMTRL